MSKGVGGPDSENQEEFISYVIEAVEALAKGKGNGVSRQTIIRYVEEAFAERKKTESEPEPASAVKSAIRAALKLGLLVHTSGVGLNGSFILTEIPRKSKSKERQTPCKKPEAKLTNISLLASETQKYSSKGGNISTRRTRRTARRQSSKKLPMEQMEFDKDNLPDCGDSVKSIKTILKPPSRTKVSAKRKGKMVLRKVKFSSPPRVVYFAPSSTTKRSKRKK